ncbi:MAG TPA: NnrU family protein [Usitatibacter sp.]|nr:NnrU family protein [Usitatibacter sp.]
MEPLYHLALASLVFLGTHFVSSTPLRVTLVESIGEKAYLGAYSLVSFLTIGWMIWAYGRAPSVPWFQIPGVRLWPLVVMPFALILICAGVLIPNPALVGQRAALKAEEPARGILRVTRHPIFWGIGLWAAVHLIARGDIASCIFFGTFVVLALAGTKLIDMRKDETLGEDWKRFAAVTSNVPFTAIVEGRNRLVLGEIGWRPLLIALALYAALLIAHPYLFHARPY